MSGKKVRVWVQQFHDRATLQLQWHDPATGRRRTKTAGTSNPASAEQTRADLEYELNHGLHRDTARISWDRFRELFEAEYLPNLRPATRLLYSNLFDHFGRICGAPGLDSITTRTVSRFLAGLRQVPGRGPSGQNGLQPSTLFTSLAYLRAALRWAHRQGFLAALPEFPEVKVPKTKPLPVPPELFERLLCRTRDPFLRAFVSSGWLAGLRLGEAHCLRWEGPAGEPWLDLPGQCVRLPAGFVKAAEDQIAWLTPGLQEMLDALPRTHAPYVFPWRHLTREAVGLKVRTLARRAGVRLSMRALRRGFACEWAGLVEAQVLREMMRHSDIKVTLDYYANARRAAREAVLGARRSGGRNAGMENPSKSQGNG